MNTTKKATSIDRKVLLSTIWIFATFSYLYCDVVSLMDSNLLKQYLTGTVNGMVFNQGYLLAAGILMTLPMVMVLLSRVLNYKTNRWVNIIAGAIMTVVQTLTLFVGKPALYYVFFSILEIASTVLIIWFAAKWPNSEGLS